MYEKYYFTLMNLTKKENNFRGNCLGNLDVCRTTIFEEVKKKKNWQNF